MVNGKCLCIQHTSGGSNRCAIGVTDAMLRNGQLIFFTGDVFTDPVTHLHTFYYFDYSTSSWRQGLVASSSQNFPRNGEVINGSGDRIYTLPAFNSSVYGSQFAHSGGSHYGLRRGSFLQTTNGSSWTTVKNLTTAHRVIIAAGQGHTYSNLINTTVNNRVRCWGYIENGRTIETFGSYVHINFITNDPSGYALHTR